MNDQSRVNETAEEEYILAMRTTAYREDSDLWKERRSQPLKPGHTTVLTRRKTKTKSLLPMSDNHTTKVLASLVPDEIIYNVDDYSNRHYDCCLLFGDVSGFTDLCEAYNKTGKGGPSRLTVVLNNYIGNMVQEVISHNGDILKFSGDAFLAMYKCETSDSLQDVVHEAVDSAIMIQKMYGTYESDVGIILRVKLAVSAGHVIFSLIGDAKNSYYVVAGQPILDVKTGEKKSSAGEIIVSAAAWHYVNPNEYLYEHLGDGVHTKVKGVGLSWRPTHRNVDSKKDEVEDEADIISSASSKTGVHDDDEPSLTDLKEKYKFEDITLRPSINYAAKMNMRDSLRKFIIAPIMRGIDLDEPIDYLTEMRQIVVVFINVTTTKIDWVDYVKLIDTTYRIVCNFVNDMQGCVNKMSLFDKDLMFVVLFGLRGYKNELESQIGLRCAAECQQSIIKIPGVTTASVGVTTGVTYCGVVGHTLRREYTVISLTVNKAARLMCAYPNKVTCDRETFLHSKLEARNFILQESKPLKGITNVGPVYEFKEQIDFQIKPALNPFPLLGRTEEVQLFRNMLEKTIEIFRDKGKTNTTELLNHQNTLIIRGETRIGKTRLLDECLLCTPAEISINRFRLVKKDWKIEYQTVEYIFVTPLGLNELSSTDRETKLKARMGKLKVPQFFCAINKIFNVNFEKTNAYVTLTNHQKDIVLDKVLTQLSNVTFGSHLWIIAIDNADYIDEDSWKFLNTFIELDLVLLIMTMDQNSELSEEVLKHKRVQVINLQPIDKWYHAGLACQILDVHAIPPELEKLIQTRSRGNPGWIESFLVSLIQAGGLIIQTLTRAEIHELGLVSPAVDMMVRLTMDETKELEKIKESTVDLLASTPNEDGWKMYQFSYRDSVINVMKEKIKEKRKQFGSSIPVCTIAPTFKLEEVDPELSMDVMIIQLFDSLSSYEQLLLKCSSILGEYFPRDMLLYIMASSTPRATSLAVQKLFALRILGCAKGDFTQGDSCMMFIQRLVNPNNDNSIVCECRGIKIPEYAIDLPKYASCGYLRFRLDIFRETTYNLLTDNQKKEFHARAIRYLEKETRRCRSCGNGFFVRILGTRYDDGLAKKKKSSGQERLSLTRQSVTSRTSTDTSLISNSKLSIMQSRYKMSRFNGSGTLSRKLSIDYLENPYCCGYRMIKKLKDSMSLTRTFSYADFSSCQCPLILNTMYTQMLEHCKGAELLDKMMDALLEYAYICIMSYNIPQAMKILNDALLVLDSKKFNKDDDTRETEWKIPLIRGKIETLIGHSRLELGQMEEAYLCFQEALHQYGYKFPTKMSTIKLNSAKLELKHRLGMYCMSSLISSNTDGYEAEFCDMVSECLALLCKLFKMYNMWEHAELAAAWSLNKSLQSEKDFYGLCTAYSNMMDVANHLKNKRFCVALEVNALRLCHRKKTTVEPQELRAVAILYGAIFCSRTARAEIEKATQLAYVTMRISGTVHCSEIILQTIPLLVQLLLIQGRVPEAVTIILELEYYSVEDTDNSARTWYFALCVGLQLESGYTVVPVRKCETFHQIEHAAREGIRDSDAERRFYTCMWLWYIRNEEWEAATLWYSKACNFSSLHERDSIYNIITTVYLFEGLLLYLVGKIDKRNVDAVGFAYEEINKLIALLDKMSSQSKIILPRLLHLKAYYKFIQNDEALAFNMLKKARKISEQQGNLLEVAWIDHNEKAWNNNLSSILVDFWKEHCEPDNLLDYHEIELNEGKLGLFTLPVPMYY